MQYCLPKSFFETSGREASTFLLLVWMGIQYRFKVQAITSADAWRWDCCVPCEVSGGDWMYPCAQKDNSSESTTLNPSSCDTILPCLSLVGQLRADFSGGGRGIRETSVKEERLVLSWFSELNCLAEMVLSARVHWEGVLCKVEIWEAEPHPWQQQAARLASIFRF